MRDADLEACFPPLKKSTVLGEVILTPCRPQEKDWSKKVQPICEFSTVEEFWQYFNHIPRPGKVFFDGESKASVGPSNKVIDELSIFKKGIKPEWEDPQNRDGGCFYIRQGMDPDQVGGVAS